MSSKVELTAGLCLGILAGVVCCFTGGVVLYASGLYSRNAIGELVQFGVISGLVFGPLIVCRGWSPRLAAGLWGLTGLLFCLALVVLQLTLNGYELLLPFILAITVGGTVDIAAGVGAGLLVARLWERRDDLVDLRAWAQPTPPARAGIWR